MNDSIVGCRFGRLVVLEYMGEKNYQLMYRCRCECGNECVTARNNLERGSTRSCGCLAKEARARTNAKQKARAMDPKIAAEVYLYRAYKGSAKKRGHAFDLTLEQFTALTSLRCIYCDDPPSPRSIKYPDHKYNGVDRRDNKVGYTVENCVPCCTLCNRMKWTSDELDFIEQCRKVAEYHPKPK